MDVVDERAKPIDQNLVKDFIARAPTSAKAVLAVVVFLLVWFLKKHLQELNVSRRERLNHRRRAGIPDSDTRPFRTAFLDAEAKRRAREDEQRAKVAPSSARKMQSSMSMPNFQSPLVRRSNSSRALASPRAQSQFLVSSQVSNGGSSSPSAPRRSLASPSPFGFKPHPSSSSLRYEVGSPLTQQRQRKRQHGDEEDDASEDLSQIVEEKKQKLDQVDEGQPGFSRGQRRKRSETPDDADESQDQFQVAKRAKQQPQDVLSDISMQVDQSFDDSQASQVDQDDTDMGTREGSLSNEFDEEEQQQQSQTAESTHRLRSPSVDTSATSSSRSKPLRKPSRSVLGKQLPPVKAATSAAGTLSPEIKAKLAQKSHKPRPGETWKDPSGTKLRINSQGVKEQLVAVKERRHKYHMPKGSKHPSANIMEERIVDKWLDELSYEDYKRQGLLAWQTEEDAKYEQAKLQKATGLHSSSPIQDESDGSIFFARGASPSISRFQSPGRPRGDSIGNIELLPNGRVKLPRSRSQHLTPRRSLATLEQDSTKKKKAFDRSPSQLFGGVESQSGLTSTSTALTSSEPVQETKLTPAPSTDSPFSFSSKPNSEQSDSSKASTPAPVAAAQPFNIGASGAPVSSASSTSPAKSATSAPTFSFGKTEGAPATNPSQASKESASSPFSFGTSSSTATSAASKEMSKPSTSPFSFGTGATSPAPTAGSPAPTSKPLFGSMDSKTASGSQPLSFNSPAPEAQKSSSGGFSFGAAPPSSSNPTSSSVSTPSAAAPAFTFGAPSQATAPATPGGSFKFETGSTAAPSPGTGTPASSNRSSRARANPSRRRI